jgi:hypothetical protein
MRSVVLALRKALAYCDEIPTKNTMVVHELTENDEERSVFKLRWGYTVAFEFEVIVNNKIGSVVACVLHRHRFNRSRMDAIMGAFMNAINNNDLDMPPLDGNQDIIIGDSDSEDSPAG